MREVVARQRLRRKRLPDRGNKVHFVVDEAMSGPFPRVKQMFKVRKWSKESVVAELRARHEKGQSLAYIDGPGALIQAAKARFGSYPLALEAAGIDYNTIRRHRSWSRREAIEEIQ